MNRHDANEHNRTKAMKRTDPMAYAFGLGLLSGPVVGQPTIQWQRCLGGSGDDQGAQITYQFLYQGNTLTVGTTGSNDGDVSGNHGAEDIWLACLDTTGVLLWQRCLGGSSSDHGHAMTRAFVNPIVAGHIIAGSTASNDGDISGNQGNYDMWFGMLAGGDLLWSNCIGGTGLEDAYGIVQSPEAIPEFFVVGSSNSNDGDLPSNHGLSDQVVGAIDYYGAEVFKRCNGGSDMEKGMAVDWTNVGDYDFVTAGSTSSNDGDVSGAHGGSDLWVAGHSTNGINWQRALGGSGEDYGHAVDFVVSWLDGGHTIVAGRTSSNDGDVSGNHGGTDAWVVKLDYDGDLVWQKCLGGSGDDGATDIVRTYDNGYLISGYTNSNDGDVSGNHGDEDAWLVKLDLNGNLLWQKCLGGSNDDIAFSVIETTDGSYINVAGYTESNDGDVSGNHGGSDMWVVQLSSAGGNMIGEVVPGLFTVAPNPALSNISITWPRDRAALGVSLHDATGRMVLQRPISTLSSSFPLDISDQEDGLYLIVVQFADGTRSSTPMVKE